MNHTLEEQIFDITIKNGYILEQEVAEIMESLQFIVLHSYPYEDYDLKSSREIGVIATKKIASYIDSEDPNKKVSILITLIIECKSGSGIFTFIGKQKKDSDREIIYNDYFPASSCVLRENGVWKQENKDIFEYLKIYKLHYSQSQKFKTSQFIRLSNNQGKLVYDDKAHDNIFQKHVLPPIKTLIDMKKKNFPNDIECRDVIRIYFPIVVINGDIYYMDYTAKNKNDVQKIGSISFNHNMVVDSKTNSFRIDFVSKDDLIEFVNTKILPYASYISQIVSADPKSFIQTKVHPNDFGMLNDATQKIIDTISSQSQ